MTKPDVLQLGPFPPHDQDPMDRAFRMHAYHLSEDKTKLLQQVGPKVRAIVTRGGIGASREVIDACAALEIITVYGVGYDAVDMDICKTRDIRVTNTPDVLTKDVADLGVAMMLALGRGVVGAHDWVQSGDWAAKGAFTLQRRIWGRKAGILGLGRIGTEVARRLKGFDMEIHYTDVAPRDVEWTFHPDATALAKASDVLFVTLAASKETRKIVGREVIEALGSDGMLVNISRASNVDEEALLDALETGTLGSAALDVFADEPNINLRFLALQNVLLQPHHASATHETRADMGRLMRANLNAHFANQPLITPVN